MTPETEAVLREISRPFYLRVDFWISTLLGVAGLVFSLLAFVEAKQAKRAASAAGTTVKLQTVVIELSEVSQHLDRLEGEISFTDARDLLNETSRKLHRLIAPFQERPELSEVCAKLKEALVEARAALGRVQPTSQFNGDLAITENSVYFAMQGHFSAISALVAELMGLCEKRTIPSTA